tara:strand:+ start:4448 stop:4693 length:246 start_codon:yes stop_codon:yes gene_type:complete
VTLTERDTLILEAALDFGADYYYHIKNGTLGITLYIEAPNKPEAGRIRKEAPCFWKGLYVVVLYTSDPDFRDDPLPDPVLA